MAKIQKTANTADKKPVYRVKEKPTLMGILLLYSLPLFP